MSLVSAAAGGLSILKLSADTVLLSLIKHSQLVMLLRERFS